MSRANSGRKLSAFAASGRTAIIAWFSHNPEPGGQSRRKGKMDLKTFNHGAVEIFAKFGQVYTNYNNETHIIGKLRTQWSGFKCVIDTHILKDGLYAKGDHETAPLYFNQALATDVAIAYNKTAREG